MNMIFEPLRQVADLGGPVVMVLMGVSVIALATVLYKLWQFSAAGVGRHKALREAISAWDRGDRAGAVLGPQLLKPRRGIVLPREGRVEPLRGVPVEAPLALQERHTLL